MNRSINKNNIYTKVLLTQKIPVNYREVNNNLYNILENKIKNNVEGLCIKEGYVKPESVKLVSSSSGELYSNKVLFDVIYDCLVANPVESMVFDCIVKSITKVGIRAELEEEVSPFIIFIARDHHYNNDLFSKINEGDIITVRVIGQRFELNNKFISIIAELININSYDTTNLESENPEDFEGGNIPKMKIKLNRKHPALKNKKKN
jgi:DNA-directed RNA polymerase subunit E'/Rpb7